VIHLKARSGAENRRVDGLKVSADSCHVHPLAVTVELDT
jgi:hypothetical protein